MDELLEAFIRAAYLDDRQALDALRREIRECVQEGLLANERLRSSAERRHDQGIADASGLPNDSPALALHIARKAATILEAGYRILGERGAVR